MRIVGVDGALEMTGLCAMNSEGIVEDLSVIRTRVKKSTPTESKRLEQIYLEFRDYLYLYQPDAVVIESQHVNRRNPKTSLVLARARSIIQLVCALEEIPLYLLQPSQAKNGVGCKGNAAKNIIQEAVVDLYSHQALVQEKLGEFIETGMRKTDDMADALALCHTFRTTPSIAVLS